MYYRIIAILAITLAAFGLVGCESRELVEARAALATAKAERGQAIKVADSLTSYNDELKRELKDREAKVAQLTADLADERAAKLRERNAKAVARIELQGAKKVAGAAVDKAHAKGVKDAQLGIKSTVKPTANTTPTKKP